MDDLTNAPFDMADLNRLQYGHDLRPLALEETKGKLTRMLRDTLEDHNRRFSIVKQLGLPLPADARRLRPRCTVDIYHHNHGLTFEDARRIRKELQGFGIGCRLLEHDDPEGPDAVFIGPLVEAIDARNVLARVPYPIRYVFRPDYPEVEGGSGDGNKIGIGYCSRYNESRRRNRAVPIAVSEEAMRALLDDDHTNTSFQTLLWEQALTYKG